MKVTMLGDSIRLFGYGELVTKLLGKEYEFFQPDNCCYSKFTLRGLFDWGSSMEGSRIVHRNNGLWDVSDYYGDGVLATEDEYVTTIVRIADLLLKKHEKIIFATTTPVRNDNTYIENSVIERYNSIIVPALREKGIIINDLYTPPAKALDRYISDDKIHLSHEGAKICAELVAGIIKSTAEALNTDPEAADDLLRPKKTVQTECRLNKTDTGQRRKRQYVARI
ncbi:MAG: hypothetical protein IKV54_02660 [Clostridia bacterium]|nr:hypothetical protein [Clostridia bacterium]